MPFSIDIPTSNPENNLHFMFDHRNILFTWGADSSSSESEHRAFNTRDRIMKLFNSYDLIHPYLLGEESLPDMEDLRHDAFEHISTYDRHECLHFHMTFNLDVDFKMVELVFAAFAINIHSFTDLFSRETIPSILSAVEKYFNELETSPTMQAIEGSYREQKNKEFERATLQDKDEERRKTNHQNFLNQQSSVEKLHDREESPEPTLTDLLLRLAVLRKLEQTLFNIFSANDEASSPVPQAPVRYPFSFFPLGNENVEEGSDQETTPRAGSPNLP